MEQYHKEDVGFGELSIYQVLSSTSIQAYNDHFSTLIIPQAISIDVGHRTLTLPYYDGATFNEAWSISNGGADMELSLSREIPEILQDLSKIDPALFTDHSALANIPNLTYNHGEVADYFSGLAATLRNAGHVSTEELKAIKAILAHEQTTEKIISNGDFYPRNFIKMPDGKVVLIDWETWNNHSPFFIIDHPENVAAVQYVHMWGNSGWQTAFLTELARHFSFSEESFTKGVMMKALTLATFFPEHEELFRGQLQTIKQMITKK